MNEQATLNSHHQPEFTSSRGNYQFLALVRFFFPNLTIFCYLKRRSLTASIIQFVDFAESFESLCELNRDNRNETVHHFRFDRCREYLKVFKCAGRLNSNSIFRHSQAYADFKVTSGDELHAFRDTCKTELSLSDENIEQFKKWEFTAPESACYINCMFRHMHLYDNDSGFLVTSNSNLILVQS